MILHKLYRQNILKTLVKME